MNPSHRRWEIWRHAVGIALLYTSAFYLPRVGVPANYWLPHVGRQILFPAAVGTLILIPAARLLLTPYLRSTTFWSQVPIAALVLVAIAGGFSSAGYSASDLAMDVFGADTTVDASRWSRVTTFTVAFVVVCAGLASLRTRREALVRVLSLVGYTFAVLAILRTGQFVFLSKPHASSAYPVTTAFDRHALTPSSARPREVIWIIFDELDFNQTLGSAAVREANSLPNLLALSKAGISATQAYSPARDTQVSIPSLLLDTSPVGVRITRNGLSIHARDGTFQPFDEAHSVFARLPNGPASGAILGFYHPYCWVFPSVVPCVAMPQDNVGRWFDALVPFSQPITAAARWLPGLGAILPGSLFREFEPMYSISEKTAEQFPRFLGLQGTSLVFMHVNLPHPPGDYSQRALHLATVADDREAYRRNLRLVDDMLGVVLAAVRAQTRVRDVLLIVSSDHWHRIDSPHRIQRIPWIAWHVGEEAGAVLDQQISTVHTAELCLDFLRGNVQSQAEIPGWWQKRSFYPPLMPEHYRD